MLFVFSCCSGGTEVAFPFSFVVLVERWESERLRLKSGELKLQIIQFSMPCPPCLKIILKKSHFIIQSKIKRHLGWFLNTVLPILLFYSICALLYLKIGIDFFLGIFSWCKRFFFWCSLRFISLIHDKTTDYTGVLNVETQLLAFTLTTITFRNVVKNSFKLIKNPKSILSFF